MRKTLLIITTTACLVGGTSGVALAQDGPAFDFTRIGSPTENHEAALQDVAILPDGTIAISGGMFSDEAPDGWQRMVWASADEGETWTATAIDIEVVAALGDSFVGAGASPDFPEVQQSIVYTSPDGVSWETALTLDDVAPNHELVPVADGIAFLAQDMHGGVWEEELGHPTLWTSSDASSWEAQEISGPLSPDAFSSWYGLARSTDGRWLFMGRADTENGGDGPPDLTFHVLTSADGAEWSEGVAPFPDSTAGGMKMISQPHPTAAGFVSSVASEDPNDPTGIVLTSDGTDWELVADIPAPDLHLVTDGSQAVGFQLPFLMGEGGPPSLTEGALVYVSADGRTWEPSGVLESGTVITGAFMPGGRLLVVGSDISECREFFCVFGPGNGAIPTVWVGTPQ
jgi:hypothetical protein